MNKSISNVALAALFGVTVLSGCAVDPAPVVSEEMGQAVRAAQATQTLNPEASKNSDPVSGIDGVAAKNAVSTYQKSFQAPPPTFTVINVGGGASTR